MRVLNDTDHGVFVANYGVVPAGEEATVRDSPAVRQLIKDKVFKERKTDSGNTTDKKEGDG